jgi:membrane-associated protein
MHHNLLNPYYLLTLFGYIGLGAVIFTESGILLGFFLPGDTLLISAGILVSHGHLNLVAVWGTVTVAAIAGNGVGYLVGAQFGSKLFQRKNSKLFSKHNLEEAHAFFEKYGAQSVILARFVPVARTFIPVVVGMSAMSYRKFFTYSAIGAVSWGVIMTLLGYTLGRVIPHIDTYIFPAVIVITVLTLLPAVWQMYKRQKDGAGDKDKETP